MKTPKSVLLLLTMVMVCAFQTKADAGPALSRTSAAIYVGDTVNLNIKHRNGRSVSWKSGNTGIATVNAAGIVRGKRPGSTTITATVGRSHLKCTVSVKTAPYGIKFEKWDKAARNAIKTILLFREKGYPDGTFFNNSIRYEWNSGICRGGFGCAAFAYMLSDAVFGHRPGRIVRNTNSLRPGDIIRYDVHSVIVLDVNGNDVTVAEANVNKAVRWGHVYPKAGDPNLPFSFVITRW
ncbi:MAG: Ig-like domain-containing protein [Lachnospiraceae bacterium]|nr:Ig-like domain-containing protein [Lachnospiraceae bacterium]